MAGTHALASGRLPTWAGPVAVGAAGLGLCAALVLVDPNRPGSYGVCPFRFATGWDCPGCGTLRALHALLGGNLLLAADHNLLTVVLLPVLLVVWVRWFTSSLRGSGVLPSATPTFAYGVAIVTALFWVARNLPWAPFAWFGSAAS